MSRLNDAVPSGPAPEQEPADNEQIPANEDPEAKGDDGDGKVGEKSERPIENVRAELIRKMEQGQEVLLAKI